ncbi:MAG: phospholipase D-like domain-containing protein [Nocardioides sp.]
MRAARLAVGGALVGLVATMAAVPAVAQTQPTSASLSTSVLTDGTLGRSGVTPAARRKPQGFIPDKGVLLSNPYASNRREILTRVIQTIKNTAKGQTVRIAVWNFADPPTTKALVRADQRGVNVQLVVAGSVVGPQWEAVKAQLNRNKSDDSFAVKCKGACRSRAKIMHSKVFLFSRVRSVKNISMFGSANLTTPAGNRQWNDMVTTYSPQLYDYFVTMFDEYAKDRRAKKVYQEVDLGHDRVYLYPTGKDRNPIRDELRLVRCNGAKGMPGGHTKIRIAIAGWFDDYGTQIAKRVRRLWEQGCDVKIITTLAGRGVNRTLKSGRGRGPVPIRRLEVDNNGDGVAERYLHMKAIAITGVFDRNPRAKVVITGSPNWSARAARSDEVLVRLARAGGMALKYQRHVDNLFSSPYTHTNPPSQGTTDLNARGLAPVRLSPREFYRLGDRLPSWYELD